MQTPTISHRQFLILCGLIDGREKRQCELIKELDYKGQSSVFSRSCSSLQRDGLIEKHEVLQRLAFSRSGRPLSKTHQLQTHWLMRITEAGREAWREAADFYLHLLQRFAEQGNGEGADETDSRVVDLHRKPLPVAASYQKELEHDRTRQAQLRRISTSLNRNGRKRCQRQ